MAEKNITENLKQKVINTFKNTFKNIAKFLFKVLKPYIITMLVSFIIIILLASFVWVIDKNLFDTASSSSTIFNKGGTTYIDPETEEEIELIGIDEEETMWVIPTETVNYVRRQIMETTDIVRLNLAEDIDDYSDLETPENKEKLNKYIREFLKTEQAGYYPNLDVE